MAFSWLSDGISASVKVIAKMRVPDLYQCIRSRADRGYAEFCLGNRLQKRQLKEMNSHGTARNRA